MSKAIRSHSKCWLLVIGLGILALIPISAHADYLFVTQTNTSSVDASAYFVLSGDTLTLTLTNLESGIVSASQAISGLQFTVSDPPTTPITGSSSSVTLNSVSGNVVQINNSSPYITGQGTILYTSSSNSLTGSTQQLANSNWSVGTTNGLTALSGGKPNHLILGPGDGSTFNPSIFQHQPDFQSSASFNLTVPHMASTSKISGVTFYFGTSQTTEPVVPGTPGPNTGPGGLVLPTPPSYALFALGSLALLGFMAQSRRRLLAAA